MTTPLRLVVLISGNGSTLQAFIDQIAAGRLEATIAAVISNQADAYGLERARQAGIAAEVLSHRNFGSREAFDRALIRQIDSHRPELVVLAGFMRILGSEFVRHYKDRLLNIHPSLLPKYPGLHTHERALEAGDAEHGSSVHFVTEELDGGPVVAQVRVRVQAGDTPETLKARVQKAEQALYPEVVGWLAGGRLRQEQGRIFFDDAPLREPRVTLSEDA